MIRWPRHRHTGIEERRAVFSSWKSNFLDLDRLQIAKNTEKRKTETECVWKRGVKIARFH
jgi:hypothetical protein